MAGGGEGNEKWQLGDVTNFVPLVSNQYETRILHFRFFSDNKYFARL